MTARSSNGPANTTSPTLGLSRDGPQWAHHCSELPYRLRCPTIVFKCLQQRVVYSTLLCCTHNSFLNPTLSPKSAPIFKTNRTVHNAVLRSSGSVTWTTLRGVMRFWLAVYWHMVYSGCYTAVAGYRKQGQGLGRVTGRDRGRDRATGHLRHLEVDSRPSPGQAVHSSGPASKKAKEIVSVCVLESRR